MTMCLIYVLNVFYKMKSQLAIQLISGPDSRCECVCVCVCECVFVCLCVCLCACVCVCVCLWKNSQIFHEFLHEYTICHKLDTDRNSHISTCR